LPLRWALGGSRRRSRAFERSLWQKAAHCAKSRVGCSFRGFAKTLLSESVQADWRPSQGQSAGSNPLEIGVPVPWTRTPGGRPRWRCTSNEGVAGRAGTAHSVDLGRRAPGRSGRSQSSATYRIPGKPIAQRRSNPAGASVAFVSGSRHGTRASASNGPTALWAVPLGDSNPCDSRSGHGPAPPATEVEIGCQGPEVSRTAPEAWPLGGSCPSGVRGDGLAPAHRFGQAVLPKILPIPREKR
jgi:hypothetical protein